MHFENLNCGSQNKRDMVTWEVNRERRLKNCWMKQSCELSFSFSCQLQLWWSNFLRRMDPNSNSLLRTFECSLSDLDRFISSNWEPPVKLTTHEQEIVKHPGSSLLQGRGGTGKTLCLISRWATLMVCWHFGLWFRLRASKREVDEIWSVTPDAGFLTISCEAWRYRKVFWSRRFRRWKNQKKEFFLSPIPIGISGKVCGLGLCAAFMVHV